MKRLIKNKLLVLKEKIVVVNILSENKYFYDMEKYLTKSKIFVAIMISFLIGVFIAPEILFNSKIIIYTILILLILFFIFRKIKILSLYALLGIILFLGITYYHGYYQNILPKDLPYKENIEAIGQIYLEPDIRSDKIKYSINISDVISPKNNNLIGEKILITANRYPEYQYGDVVKISGKLEKPEKIDNFDYGLYLLRYNIFSVIYNTNVELIQGNQGNKLYKFLLHIKEKIKNSLEKILPEPASSLAEGLIIGIKGNFSPELKGQMIQTGTTHIVVVSGQNMEIVTRAFVEITRYLSPLWTFFTGITGLVLFTILTGASPSVVRAAILSSLFLLAMIVGRRKQIFIPLVFAGFIMVLSNPLILRYDIGFQLSFMAMLGLIFISPLIDNFLKKWPLFFREIISSTLGAQITTLPIILYNFGRVSVIAPITNSLILLVVPYAMLASFIIGTIGSIFLPLGKLLGFVAWPILQYIILVINYFSKIPYASVEFNFHNWQGILIYYLLLSIIVVLLNKYYARGKNNKK